MCGFDPNMVQNQIFGNELAIQNVNPKVVTQLSRFHRACQATSQLVMTRLRRAYPSGRRCHRKFFFGAMALLSDRVREAFKTWDTEGDGTITKTGLKLWLGDSVRNIWDFQKKT